MTKQLPPLSIAQFEAWKRILEWHGREGNAPFTSYEISVYSGTLDALKRKGILNKHIPMFNTVKPSYSIHPDYLPSEPDAAPVADAAAVGKFAEGQRVYLPGNKAFKDTQEPAYGTVQYVEDHTNSNGESFQRVWVQFDNPKRGLMEVHPSFLIIASTATVEDEPADAAPVEQINGVPLFVYEDFDSIRQSGAINMVDRAGFCRLAIGSVEEWVRREKDNYSRVLQGYDAWREWKAARAAAVEDERPTVTEARLMDTIAELKARVADLEAENERLNDECEVLSGKLVQMGQARDFWRVKFERVILENTHLKASLDFWRPTDEHLTNANQETEADNG